MSIEAVAAPVQQITTMEHALSGAAGPLAAAPGLSPAAAAAGARAGTPPSFATSLAAAQATAAGVSSVTNTTLGATTDPVPGATGSRLDQGLDGTTQTFVAPFNGTVVYSTANDPGWNGGGYVAIRSAADPGKVFFAAEGLDPTVNVGESVTAGEQIAQPKANPYNGIAGNFEIGWANPSSPGQPLAQTEANPRQTVLAFYGWLRSLGGPTATSTAGAGYA